MDSGVASGFTVADLIAAPVFQLRLVAGRAGTHRPVRWAHSTELLDPRSHLRGNELVLTVGLALTTAERCAAFADAVAASHAAAIGFGVGDVLNEAPPALRQACDRLGVPLVEVPEQVPFMTFTEWLAERVAHLHDRAHDRREAGHLLELIRKGLAAPDAIRDLLSSSTALTSTIGVLTFKAETAVTLHTVPGILIGETDQLGYAVVAGETEVHSIAPHVQPAGSATAAAVGQLPTAITASRLAFDLACQRGGMVTSDALATFDALWEQLSNERLVPFVTQLVTPVASYDARHRTGLLATLRAFVAHGGSITAAAHELYLHPNTMRNRLARVETLTGRDPIAFEDHVCFAVAVCAWDKRPGIRPRQTD